MPGTDSSNPACSSSESGANHARGQFYDTLVYEGAAALGRRGIEEVCPDCQTGTVASAYSFFDEMKREPTRFVRR
jgi:hypothetical protein